MGMILFQDNNTCYTSPVVVDSSGQAIFTTSYLSVDSHNIVASYCGDNNFASSTGSVSQLVNTTTAPMISLGTPAINGLGVSINGGTLPTVPGAVITGISWNWGDTNANTGWFPQTHTYNALGTYTVTVTSTDSNGKNQSAQTTVVINQTTTRTSTILNTSYNPSFIGQSVTFTANVNPIPTGGSVQFNIDNANVGIPVGVNSAGQASYTATGLSVGNHTIAASYGGYNAIFNPSSGTMTEIVNTQETPSIQIWFNGPIVGLTVSVNGITLPNPSVPGAVITGVVWNRVMAK